MGVTTTTKAARQSRFANPMDVYILVFKIVILGLVYYVAARLSLQVALVGTTVTPVWPPTGIALVGLLVFGGRVWPAITIAAFLANLDPGPWWVAGVIAIGNTLAPVLAYSLLKWMKFRPEMDRLRDALVLVFLAALAAMTVSATIGSTVLRFGPPKKDFTEAWSVWWTGDAMGVLVFAPFLLVLVRARFHAGGTWKRRLEGLVLAAGAGVTSYYVSRSDLSLLYLVFPFLIWAALRFQMNGTAPVVLIVTLITVSAAVDGVGPFRRLDLLNRMVTLQAFNGSVALTSFLLAAMTSERWRARQALEHLRRKQALELNDEVIQGLSVVKYALELNDRPTMQRAADRTLDAARDIVNELLRTTEEGLGPGDLVRARPADLRADPKERER